MRIDTILVKILKWIPSLFLLCYYVPNGLDKLLDPSQKGKVVESSIVMIIAGCYILISLLLFLYNKTLVLGAAMLVLYMSFIVFIHMYKAKPFEVVMLILIATVFATFVRKSSLFMSDT